jgi:hypothetical protein
MDINQNNNDLNTFTKTQVDIMNYIRVLWEQHSVWTRSAITSLVFDLPNENYVVDRLLQNPVDFYNILEVFYENSALEFQELLTEHLVLAADIIVASKEGDEEGAKQAEQLWYENADAIAAFLGSINPYWSNEQWKEMLYNHLDLVKAEAVSMLTGQYEESISIYDDIEIQALGMADVMSQGIIKQFEIN